MPLIVETIVTTRSLAGEVHIAPLGLIAEGENWIIAPFAPSRTLDNLRENPVAVANHVDDVRIFAGCLTGRRNWPVRRAEKVDGAVLRAASDLASASSPLEIWGRPQHPCRARPACTPAALRTSSAASPMSGS